MSEHVILKFLLNAEEVESFKRIVASSKFRTRSEFVQSVLQEIIADEIAEQAGEEAA